MARPGWAYRNRESYWLNSYGKPALTLQTLEGLLGDETMTRILRTYARRFRFAHPTTEHFIATVNEVTGQDWRWFFDETFFSSGRCDYAIEAQNERSRRIEGWAEGPDGRLVLHPVEGGDRDDETGPRDSTVTVTRRGEVRMPVDIAVWFADGRRVAESWDGKDRWRRFRYPGAKVVRAVVDPRRRIALDVDPANNVWVEAEGAARRAATKWAARWMFWLQNLLELHTLLG